MARNVTMRPRFASCLCVLLGATLAACAAGRSTNGGPFLDAGGVESSSDGPAPILDTGMNEAGACLEADGWVEVEPSADYDHDGWAINQGDCNDCDPNTNPGAFDVAANAIDEDCSGASDDEPAYCDTELQLTSNDPLDGARAMGLCRFLDSGSEDPKNKTWGVLSAEYVLADRSLGMHYASHGILPDFGPNVHPQAGTQLLALSSAAARRPGDVGYRSPIQGDMQTSCTTPAGWPKDFPSCPGSVSTARIANDSAALALRLRVPTNAHGFSFKFTFYSTEFPGWVCKQFNDYFLALIGSSAPNPGISDGNLAFDPQGNAISVNAAFLEVCTPQIAGGKSFPCVQGNGALAGTGFEASNEEPLGHAATGWLVSQAAVTPGEAIDVMFVIWDSGDHLQGSTVLIDDFAWIAEPGTAPQTVRVPDPK